MFLVMPLRFINITCSNSVCVCAGWVKSPTPSSVSNTETEKCIDTTDFSWNFMHDCTSIPLMSKPIGRNHLLNIIIGFSGLRKTITRVFETFLTSLFVFSFRNVLYETFACGKGCDSKMRHSGSSFQNQTKSRVLVSIRSPELALSINRVAKLRSGSLPSCLSVITIVRWHLIIV